MKEKCTRSIEQNVTRLIEKGTKGYPDKTSIGFVVLVKDQDYDLDKIAFHYNPKEDSSIREDIRASSFKKKAEAKKGGK